MSAEASGEGLGSEPPAGVCVRPAAAPSGVCARAAAAVPGSVCVREEKPAGAGLGLGAGLAGSKYVKLNVGGALHYTTVQTLRKEESMLSSICDGHTPVTIDNEGWVVLDRCGRHFGLVLNFLRDGTVPLPESSRELEEVLKEAQFYRVQGLVQHCLSTLQKRRSVYEGVCRIPMITSAKEEQMMIATCRKPVVKLQNNRGNNKYSYTSNSDDNLLKNIELFDKLGLRFNGRVVFMKDVLGEEICCWSFYGEGRKIAEVCCTSIVYATEKKQTKDNLVKVGDWVFIKAISRKSWSDPRWEGPHQVLIATPTAVKVEGKTTWVHLSHCKLRTLPE